MFKKEVQSLFILVALDNSNYSEWGAPSFAQLKPKINQVCFLSDFRNLNKQFKCKSYPIRNIDEMLLN